MKILNQEINVGDMVWIKTNKDKEYYGFVYNFYKSFFKREDIIELSMNLYEGFFDNVNPSNINIKKIKEIKKLKFEDE